MSDCTKCKDNRILSRYFTSHSIVVFSINLYINIAVTCHFCPGVKLILLSLKFCVQENSIDATICQMLFQPVLECNYKLTLDIVLFYQVISKKQNILIFLIFYKNISLINLFIYLLIFIHDFKNNQNNCLIIFIN